MDLSQLLQSIPFLSDILLSVHPYYLKGLYSSCIDIHNVLDMWSINSKFLCKYGHIDGNEINLYRKAKVHHTIKYSCLMSPILESKNRVPSLLLYYYSLKHNYGNPQNFLPKSIRKLDYALLAFEYGKKDLLKYIYQNTDVGSKNQVAISCLLPNWMAINDMKYYLTAFYRIYKSLSDNAYLSVKNIAVILFRLYCKMNLNDHESAVAITGQSERRTHFLEEYINHSLEFPTLKEIADDTGYIGKIRKLKDIELDSYYFPDPNRLIESCDANFNTSRTKMGTHLLGRNILKLQSLKNRIIHSNADIIHVDEAYRGYVYNACHRYDLQLLWELDHPGKKFVKTKKYKPLSLFSSNIKNNSKIRFT